MHVKLWTQGIFTAAGKNYKNIHTIYNIWVQKAYFNFAQFSTQNSKFFYAPSQLLVAIKTYQRDNLFIPQIFFCGPWKVSYATDVSHYVKAGLFSNLYAFYWSKN